MAGDMLDIGGIDIDTFYSQITKVGITEADAKILVGSLLVRDRVPHRFQYATAFPAEDVTCAPTFDRSFRHIDWVDGESVVQAEETTGEQGFNRRFHRIEADLDSLGADLALAFTCLAAMRRSLRSLLDEIRVEIDRINTLLADRDTGPIVQLPPKGPIEFLGKTKVGTADRYILREGEEFHLVDFGPLVSPVEPIPGDWVKSIPGESLVDVFTAATETIRTTPELIDAIRGGATVDDIRTRFGDTQLTSTDAGTPLVLRDVLKDVPGTTTFVDAADPAAAVLSAAVRAAGEAPAGTLREVVLREPARDLTGTDLLESAPSVLTSVSRDFARNLRSAGVVSVDSLARSSGPELVAALESAGVANVDPLAVTRAITAARVARSVGRVG